SGIKDRLQGRTLFGAERFHCLCPDRPERGRERVAAAIGRGLAGEPAEILFSEGKRPAVPDAAEQERIVDFLFLRRALSQSSHELRGGCWRLEIGEDFGEREVGLDGFHREYRVEFCNQASAGLVVGSAQSYEGQRVGPQQVNAIGSGQLPPVDSIQRLK